MTGSRLVKPASKDPKLEKKLMRKLGPIMPGWILRFAEVPEEACELPISCIINHMTALGYPSLNHAPVSSSSYGADAYRPRASEDLFEISSAHEYLSLVQSAKRGQMASFDYGDPKKNIDAYGKKSAPIYDVSSINGTNISIWYGSNDKVVRYKALEDTIERFKGN